MLALKKKKCLQFEYICKSSKKAEKKTPRHHMEVTRLDTYGGKGAV